MDKGRSHTGVVLLSLPSWNKEVQWDPCSKDNNTLAYNPLHITSKCSQTTECAWVIEQLIFHCFMANVNHIWEESDQIMTWIQITYHDQPRFAPRLHDHHVGLSGLRYDCVLFHSCDYGRACDLRDCDRGRVSCGPRDCGRGRVSWDPRDCGRGRTGEGWGPCFWEEEQSIFKVWHLTAQIQHTTTTQTSLRVHESVLSFAVLSV